MAYYEIPKNAVNPIASRLLDEQSGAVQTGEGMISLPYDFSGTQWAAIGNPYVNGPDGGSVLDYSRMQAAADELRNGGYQIMQAGDSVGNGSYSWVQDAQGNIVAAPQYTTNNDPAFQAAMYAAMGFAGGSAAGLAGGGGAAPAGEGLLSGMDLAADAALGSANNIGTAAAQFGSGAQFGGAAMPEFGGFSGNLTGDIAGEYGLGSLGAESAAGLVAPGAAGSGGALLAAPGASSGFGSLGAFTSQLGGLGGAPGAAGAPGAVPGAGSTLGSAASGLLDFAKANPQLIGGLLGGALGGMGSGDTSGSTYTGPMPTITRGDWKPNAQAQMMAAPNYGSKPLPTTGNANSGLWRYRGQ
jgi:hypothetical protein